MADHQVIALDLGGTKLAAGVVDREGVVLRRTQHATEQTGQDALVAQVERAIDELITPQVGALGVGIPSQIDQRAGRAGASVNVPLAGIDLRDRLSRRFGVPVALENDANAAALAEHRFGAGRGADHMVMLTLGTGVGGGLILNGDLYRGAIGAAGELGHITIDMHGGPCQGFCPGIGHMEGLASGTRAAVLAAEYAERDPPGSLGRARAAGRVLDAALVVELASAGEPDAKEILDSIGFALGLGIANLLNVFNPELVVIGGGFARAGDLVLEPARRVVAERALPTVREAVRIVPAVLGPEAGLVGCALIGFGALDSVAV